MKKIKNNKGFTLIELLAVIVIMGILMIVAIPAVTKYINSSKKDTFADSAAAYINAARYSLLNDEYDCQAPGSNGQVVYIPLFSSTTVTAPDVIDIDKGNGKSSYNKDYKNGSYVKVEYSGGKLEYSICLYDKGSNGTTGNSTSIGAVKESALGRKSILVKGTGSCSVPTGVDVCQKNV